MTELAKIETAIPAEIEAGALASLQRHAAAARGAYAGNTERALRADVAIFTAWCSDVGESPPGCGRNRRRLREDSIWSCCRMLSRRPGGAWPAEA